MKASTRIITVIIAVILIVLGGWWYFASQSGQGASDTNNVDTGTPVTTSATVDTSASANANTSANANANTSASSDVSDEAINKDVAGIDAQMSALGTDSTAADQSINVNPPVAQ